MVYLNFKSIEEVDLLYFKEYKLLMESYVKRREYEEFNTYRQAWLNNLVTSTKKVGKEYQPVFKSFEDFYKPAKEELAKQKPQKNIRKKEKEFARRIAMINSKFSDNSK